jgi:CelD/BcsL family acetyltransferase involved in cellulose biosynthesis
VRFLGHTVSDYLDIASCNAPDAAGHVVRHLAGRAGWDLIELRELDGWSAQREPLLASMREVGWSVHVSPDSACHFAPIAGSWEAFYRSRFDRHSRKDHRREWRLLEKAGVVRAEVRWSPVLEEGFLDRLAEVERGHPQGEESRPGNLNCEPWGSFLREALAGLDQRGWLVAATLHCEQSLAAYYLGFRFGGGHSVYATAYRREFRRGAAGKMLLIHCLQALWEAGGEGIDLLRGEQPFKRQWTSAVRQNLRITACRGSLGARARGWLWCSALPGLRRRAPRLHEALRLAGRRGWAAVARHGVGRLVGRPDTGGSAWPRAW